ncbi:MAG: LysE family translocator [Pseudomonadota bacterium]
MTFDTVPALLALAVGTLFTPGPNNAMLAASGAAFGVRRSVPHLLGVAIGFPAMLLIVGLALGELFRQSVLLREALRWGGALLLLWIAWKIAVSGGKDRESARIRPLRFTEAAAFQWINPKAWSMAVAATSQFVTAAAPVASAVVVALSFLSLGLVSAMTWTVGGRTIGRWLTTPARRRAFNLTMAGLIVLSTVQLVAH